MANLGILTVMLATGTRDIEIEVGQLASIMPEHFEFHLKFEFDRLSVPMSLLSFVLCGTIGAFANVYLHRDRGYFRLLHFVCDLPDRNGICLAGRNNRKRWFVGWELVGLSSALLVAYFH